MRRALTVFFAVAALLYVAYAAALFVWQDRLVFPGTLLPVPENLPKTPDARLIELLPAAMNLRQGDMKILKTAGAIVAHPFGGIMRSILLAVLQLDVREVAVVGHHDCGMTGMHCQTILDAAKSRGIEDSVIDTLRHAGIEPDPRMDFEGEPDPVCGARILHDLLQRAPESDAIFFSSERLALGAFFEAQRLGIAVPKRLAIAGFDLYEMNSQVFPAGITTIATPRREIGEQAARYLIARLETPSLGPIIKDLGFRLVERGST